MALPSYSLCPAVSVMDIVAELRLCLAAIWQKTKKHPVVTGHSAGGHLTAAMLASDWGKVAGVPADLVRAGVAISGVFDLAPLIPTSINDLVHMDETSARAASPLLWPPPPKGRTLVAAVGGNESSEFLRQSRAIAEAWARAGLKTECLVVHGTDHFTVVDELTKPTSALVAARIETSRGRPTPAEISAARRRLSIDQPADDGEQQRDVLGARQPVLAVGNLHQSRPAAREKAQQSPRVCPRHGRVLPPCRIRRAGPGRTARARGGGGGPPRSAAVIA